MTVMILFRVVHPPAGATTLIISLGFITAPSHLVVIEVAVALMALQALAVNRLAGIDYPLWSKPLPPLGLDKLTVSPPRGPTSAGDAARSGRR
jgi:CBS-domain-containing membrane protein